MVSMERGVVSPVPDPGHGARRGNLLVGCASNRATRPTAPA